MPGSRFLYKLNFKKRTWIVSWISVSSKLYKGLVVINICCFKFLQINGIIVVSNQNVVITF